LPAEIFSLVLKFRSPRQMLAVASCSSAIMQYVTYELVIRNTVLAGGAHSVFNLKAVCVMVSADSRSTLHLP
jgi:hypothetical protein